MNVKKLAMYGFILAVLFLGACGNKADTDQKEEAKPAATKGKEEKEQAAEQEPEEEAEPAEAKADEAEKEENGSILNPYIAEITDGDIEVVYTNKNPGLKHSFSDDVSISIDEYQIVRVSNMNESRKADFDNQDEGYVLTYK